MANKKGSDGRYRYRVCIGKDETGKPKYKSFYGSTAKAARAAAEAYRTAPPNPKPPLLLCTIS